jgi:hypothetical protein
MTVKTIAEIAAQYIGISEIPQNQGWNDKEFERKMLAIGWQKDWAYCALFAKLCTFEYLSQFDSTKIDGLRPLFSPMAVITYYRFKNAGYISQIPSKNCLVVWQHYENGIAQETGHMGILKKLEYPDLITIDGNTNLAGSREGDGFFEKRRTIKENVITGLKFLGFINLPEFEI